MYKTITIPIELIEWAKSLQEDYEQKPDNGTNVTYYSFADSAKDFIDKFLDECNM